MSPASIAASAPERDIRAFAAAILAVVLFAASPIATKIAVTLFDPVLAALLRGVLAAAAALPLVLGLRLGLPKQRMQLGLLGLSGLSGFVLFPLFFAIGTHFTSASHSALILAALPLFTGLFAALFDLRRPAPIWWTGCAVALAGEIYLVFSRSGVSDEGAGLMGDSIVFGAAIVASLGYVSGGRLAAAGYSSWATTFWGVIIGGALQAPFVPAFASGPSWQDAGWLGWASVLYLAIGISILGYVAWYWALGRGGVARIGVLQFLQPPLGVALAVLVLGEPLTVPIVASAAAILIGVFVARRR